MYNHFTLASHFLYNILLIFLSLTKSFLFLYRCLCFWNICIQNHTSVNIVNGIKCFKDSTKSKFRRTVIIVCINWCWTHFSHLGTIIMVMKGKIRFVCGLHSISKAQPEDETLCVVMKLHKPPYSTKVVL